MSGTANCNLCSLRAKADFLLLASTSQSLLQSQNRVFWYDSYDMKTEVECAECSIVSSFGKASQLPRLEKALSLGCGGCV